MTNFGISLFRFTCMWDNLLIHEKDRLKRLMKQIVVVEVVMTIGIVSLGKLRKIFFNINCMKLFDHQLPLGFTSLEKP